jgi:hypothetical protein
MSYAGCIQTLGSSADWQENKIKGSKQSTPAENCVKISKFLEIFELNIVIHCFIFSELCVLPYTVTVSDTILNTVICINI